MKKRISIYENNECFFVNREVISGDDLPVSYGPVFRIDKVNFDVKAFALATEKSFVNTGELIPTLLVGKDGGGYDDYLKKLLKEYGATSLKKFEKRNSLFLIDHLGEQLDFLPTVYKRVGYFGDDEFNRRLSIQGKSTLEIGEAIYHLIQNYHQEKAER